MREVGAVEAGDTLGNLLDLVERGEEITITRQGRPVAKLVRATRPYDPQRALAAVEEMKELRKGARLDGLSIKELINEGRR